jgi:hypothetical protein
MEDVQATHVWLEGSQQGSLSAGEWDLVLLMNLFLDRKYYPLVN